MSNRFGRLQPVAVFVGLGLGLAMAQDAVVPAKTNQPAAAPPLVVDTETPLLLDNPATAPERAPAKLVNNAACFVCHANYRQEFLAVTHAKGGMGCVACHGESFAHRNDENNTTPPDLMYPADKINAACQDCHLTHDAPAIQVIACWQQRGLPKADPQKIVCTDCHGQHRLTLRTVRWDKKTGDLISTNKK